MDAASLMTTFHVVMVTNASDKNKICLLGCVVLFILVDLVNIFLSLQLTIAFKCGVINNIYVSRYVIYKIYNLHVHVVRF